MKNKKVIFSKAKWVRHKNNFPNFNKWKKWNNNYIVITNKEYDRENIISYFDRNRDSIN